MTLSFDISEYAKLWLLIFPDSPRVKVRAEASFGAALRQEGVDQGVVVRPQKWRGSQRVPEDGVTVIGRGDHHSHARKFIWNGSEAQYHQLWEVDHG